MKKCTKCKVDKELTQFGKDKSKKNGLSNKCSECYKEYYKQNKEYVLKRCKEYDFKNKEKKSEYIKKFYKENKTYFQEYNNENKTKQKEYFKKRHKDNREYYIEYKKKNIDKIRIYDTNRIKNNVQAKLSKYLRITLYRLLTKTKINKSNSAIKLLGCSVDDFKQYLETQFLPEMTWDNHGKVWEIDHIKPCFTFDLSLEEQQKECFNYINMRPLFKTTNIAESFGYKDYIGNQNRPKTLGLNFEN